MEEQMESLKSPVSSSHFLHQQRKMTSDGKHMLSPLFTCPWKWDGKHQQPTALVSMIFQAQDFPQVLSLTIKNENAPQKVIFDLKRSSWAAGNTQGVPTRTCGSFLPRPLFCSTKPMGTHTHTLTRPGEQHGVPLAFPYRSKSRARG